MKWTTIKDYPNYQLTKCGKFRNKTTKRMLAAHIKSPKAQWLRIGLRKNGKRTKLMLHRVLYQTFIADIPENMTVDHIDGNKLNNDLDNLQLLTARESSKKGKRKKGKGGKYNSRIILNGEEILLGRFDTIAESEEVYYKAISMIDRGTTCEEIRRVLKTRQCRTCGERFLVEGTRRMQCIKCR